MKTVKHLAPLTVRTSLRRIFSLGLGVLVSVALLAVFLLFYGTLPNRWYQILVVSSGSMSPAIEAGDLILITRPPQQPEPGMVLTMRVSDELVTHRVVQTNPDGSFLSRGDANPQYDQWDGHKVSIVGQYRFRVPLLGTFIQQVTNGRFSNQTYSWFQDVDQVGFSLFILEKADKAEKAPIIFATPTPTATATPTIPAPSIVWDGSRLVFGAYGYNCASGPKVWAVIQNTGSAMAGTARWELYDEQSLLIASGEVAQLNAGAFITLQAPVLKGGKYSFRAFQRPGFAEDEDLWSSGIDYSIQYCESAPDPVIPPTATAMPTETPVVVAPQPTAPPTVPLPTETPTEIPAPTDTYVPTETPAPLPEELPTAENTPLPEVPLPTLNEEPTTEAAPPPEG